MSQAPHTTTACTVVTGASNGIGRAIAEALLALVVMDHALRHRAQCGDVRQDVAPIAASAA